MRQLLIAGAAGVAVTAYMGYKVWQLVPRYPEGFEAASRKKQFKQVITRIIFRLAVTAERLHLIGDSIFFIRRLFLTVKECSDILEVPVENSSLADVPVAIFKKDASAKNQKAIVYIHGGGYALGSTHSYAPWTAKLANATNSVVISVEFRAAPKHPYPAAVEDCVKVTKAVFDNAEALGIDRNRIAIAGDSAGGNLATIVALELINCDQYRLKLQVLFSVCTLPCGILPMPSALKYNFLYPVPADWYLTKYAGQKYTRAIERCVFSGQYVSIEDKQHLASFIKPNALPNDVMALITDGTNMEMDMSGCGLDKAAVDRLPAEVKAVAKLALNPRNWILMFENDQELARMPPAFFSICEYDMRRDEGLLFYAKLRSLGIQVVLSYLRKAEHIEPVLSVVNGAKKATAAARQGFEDAVAYINEKL